jgi:predicted transcriptional regulator
MTIEEIKNGLEYGDQKAIARSTGYSEVMVKKVLSGERNNGKIIKAAEMMIKGRKSLEEQITIMVQS